MTEESKKQDQQNLDEEPKPLIEDEVYPEEELDHPGWLSIAEILKISDPVFENSKFLIGYHHSSNVYALAGDTLTIVDPGNDYTIFNELEKLGFSILDIKKIVLTHGHRDHCMGVFEFLRYPPIWEKKEIEIILHAAGPMEFKKTLQEYGFTPTEIEGGETLDLGGHKWEAIHTPGHTIDSICLYHEPTKTAITGDTVLPDTISDADKAGGGSLDHYLYGLRQLMQKEIENILPGHNVPVARTGRHTIEQTYEALMMQAIDVSSDDKISWMEGASKLAEKGLLGEVVFCCDKELALRPGNVTAMQFKALTLNDMGRCEESIEILDQILAEQGDNGHALAAKGHALLGLQKYEESLPCFDDALALNPDIEEALVFKGMALTFLGRHEEAMEIEAFKTAFAERFKHEIDKRQQEKEQGETDQST
ncbi:MAG: MBL fold metallo-hydrolase [Desulfobacteraceae bacterium]|nr:MBL fold metallo-hydrolase [Desulfobacteraceae bacterium]MDH3835678.1 MBL fold metallo-hydrolase [Desulfobacteraceae bacterium]MDH3873116.1 MBL fold metallo-hydrolase [Desulfobacteraceae bacterium]